MARPQRNEVDYFPFYCKEGKVMHIIESRFGNDGYATWIKLLRLLAVTNYHFIDLTNDMEMLFVASKCHIDENKLIEIIETLVKAGEFDHELWHDHRIVWSEKFIDSIKDAYLKRSNHPLSKSELGRFLGISFTMDFSSFTGPETPQKTFNSQETTYNGSVNPQSKVKDSKVKEIPPTPSSEIDIFHHSEIVEFVNKTFDKSFTDRNLPRLHRDLINDLILAHGYTKEQILTAWGNIVKDKFHKERSFNVVTFNYLSETKTIERYLFWKNENYSPALSNAAARQTHLNSGDNVDFSTQSAK